MRWWHEYHMNTRISGCHWLIDAVFGTGLAETPNIHLHSCQTWPRLRSRVQSLLGRPHSVQTGQLHHQGVPCHVPAYKLDQIALIPFSDSLNQSSVCRLGRRDIRQRCIAFQHESQVCFHRRTRKERHPIIVQCDSTSKMCLKILQITLYMRQIRPSVPSSSSTDGLCSRVVTHAPWTDHLNPELLLCTYKYILCHCGLYPERDEDSRPPIFLQLCRHSPQRQLNEQMSSRNQPCLRRM